MADCILEMKHIAKEFSGVRALNDATYKLNAVKFMHYVVKMVLANQL